MKVYVETKINSRGILRIVDAIKRFSPEHILFTNDPYYADLVLLHVNGRLEHLKKQIALYNKPYIVAQYVLHSTLTPDVEDWLEVWEKAALVWSYYDLKRKSPKSNFNFYYSPLGADNRNFYDRNKERDINVCTTGLSYLTESVRECHLASKNLAKNSVHVGYEIGRKINCMPNLTEDQLADVYSRSVYVSGLRRIEGFELPAAEGVLCGARPIMFDRHHYREWFGDLAVFIPELPRPQVEQSLVKLFSRPVVPITDAEKAKARTRFDWKIILEGLWDKL